MRRYTRPGPRGAVTRRYTRPRVRVVLPRHVVAPLPRASRGPRGVPRCNAALQRGGRTSHRGCYLPVLGARQRPEDTHAHPFSCRASSRKRGTCAGFLSASSPSWPSVRGTDGSAFLGQAAGDRARGLALHGRSAPCAIPALRALRSPGGPPRHAPALRRSGAPRPVPYSGAVARSRPQPGSAHSPSVWQPFPPSDDAGTRPGGWRPVGRPHRPIRPAQGRMRRRSAPAPRGDGVPAHQRTGRQDGRCPGLVLGALSPGATAQTRDDRAFAAGCNATLQRPRPTRHRGGTRWL